MADRTSAEIFGTLFEYLAEERSDGRTRAFARKMWGTTGSYDFSNYQMGCDDALIKLGLARMVKCKHDPEERLQYADSSGEFDNRPETICEYC
jgi:hypothetical protein